MLGVPSLDLPPRPQGKGWYQQRVELRKETRQTLTAAQTKENVLRNITIGKEKTKQETEPKPNKPRRTAHKTDGAIPYSRRHPSSPSMTRILSAFCHDSQTRPGIHQPIIVITVGQPFTGDAAAANTGTGIRTAGAGPPAPTPCGSGPFPPGRRGRRVGLGTTRPRRRCRGPCRTAGGPVPC